MKIISLSLLVSLVSFLAFADQGRWKDGKIELAYGEVSGILCWTQQDFDSLTQKFSQFSATSPIVSIVYDYSNFEVSVATSGLNFENYTDYEMSVNDKDYLSNKLDDEKPSIKRKNKAVIDYLDGESKKR